MTDTFDRDTKSAQSYLLFFVSVCAFFIFFAFPTTTRAEFIESFSSNIVVHEDSSFGVTENIVYVFSDERHGIFRCIPTLHQEKASSIFKERFIDIDITGVKMDGEVPPYVTSVTGSEVCIQIGDPDKTITGQHTYQIFYTVSGAISYQSYGGAELYFNVSGNAWEVPIRSIEARVSSDSALLLRERACYRGTTGEMGSCQIKTEADGSVTFSGTTFGPNEGVTIAQALDRAKIANDVRERFKLAWVISILATLVIIGLGVTLYRYQTKFKKEEAIIPQYEPYEGVKPMYAGMIFDRNLDPRDITAGIVSLALHGFLKIKKIDRKVLFFFEVDDYEMTLLRLIPEDEESAFDAKIIDLIFKGEKTIGTTVTLGQLKSAYSTARENALLIQSLKSELKENLIQKGFLVGSFFTRRTSKGYEALNHLKGFKDFLRVTESQRYIFHNAPEKNAEHFMEYLPYAIAFGVEKEWAKTFQEVTIPNPDWYDGGNLGAFNAVNLTQSLGGFSTALASSSVSGGGSASSGGGSSGGGSGGGGGGSW